jgi:hypothetical protein
LQFFKVERLALKPLKRVEGNALHPRGCAKTFVNAFYATLCSGLLGGSQNHKQF